MKELYSQLTDYEKKDNWTLRFGSIYRIYLSKLWSSMIKDTKSWLFNSLMILPVVAGPIIALFTSRTLAYDEFFSLYSDIMFIGYFGLIIPLFTMYIATMMFNDEKNDRTITYLTTRPIHRFELVIVKYLTYLTIVPIFTGITTGLVYLSFGIFGGFRYWTAALWFFLGSVVASIVYGAFFMFIGLLFKKPMQFGLFFVFIWEYVLASFSQTMNKLTIAYYVKSLVVFDLYPNDPFRGAPVVFPGNEAYRFTFLSSPANALTFSVVLAVIVIVSLTLAWARLQGDQFKIPYQAGRRPGGWKYYLKEIRSFLITFGILFVTLGLVVGPINGTSKVVRRNSDADIDVSSFPNWDQGSTPSINDMGYASYVPYTFSKDDTISVVATKYYASGSTHDIWTIIIEKDIFDAFIEETQELWMEYQENYFLSGYGEVYFPTLIDDYSILAEDILDEADKAVRLNTVDAPQTLTFTAPTRGSYYVVAIVTDFDTAFGSFFYAGVSFDISGDVYRLAGYAFGWILFGFGIIISGFAIYSLISYSSADEIKRYEEQLAIATSREEDRQNKDSNIKEELPQGK